MTLALLFTSRSPQVARPRPFQHVHPDADVVVLKRRLEDRRNAWIVHQRGRASAGFGVLPRFLIDEHAAGKQQVRLAADLLSDIQRRSGQRVLVIRRLVDEQPEPAQALQTGDVPRLGEMLAGQW